MVNLDKDYTMITMMDVFGVGFMVFGIVLGLLERKLCRFLCGTCTNWQLSPCFLLFLFVGIILVVIGFSLTKIEKSKLPKIKLIKNQKKS